MTTASAVEPATAAATVELVHREREGELEASLQERL
jgi:hypothetical protein